MEAIWLYQFRLIVIGDSTVGKSCLIRRFTEGRFAQISDPTVGVDFFSRLVEIEPGKRIKLQIWDTAGQERFRSITRAYYRNSVGGLLLFDITNRRSFQNVHEWLEETKVHVQPYQIVFVLVGHKCDLDTQRQVTRHEAEKLAAAYVLFLLCRAGILSGNSRSSSNYSMHFYASTAWVSTLKVP
ncbi:ras-related protein Rab-39B isoform X2 [Caloenas nicobarica]|uniref:ras-related protein Rab-39B isoform X2 n=1 Tax=Caloenas nicobarica TaxID=187106 RepID=UPI0032B7C6FC